jgi:hypothetical protein
MPSVAGIVEFFEHPPFGLFTRDLISGTFTGTGELAATFDGLLFQPYGITWEFFSVPAGIGRRDGYVVEYEPRMIQIAAVWQMLDSHQQALEIVNSNREDYMLFTQNLPTKVGYWIYPYVEVIFHWIRL